MMTDLAWQFWGLVQMERAGTRQARAAEGLGSTESHDTPQLHHELDAFVSHLLTDRNFQ